MIHWYYIWSPKYEIFHRSLYNSLKDISGICAHPIFFEESVFLSDKSINIKILIKILNNHSNEHVIFSDADIIVNDTNIIEYLEKYIVNDITLIKSNLTYDPGLLLIKKTDEIIDILNTIIDIDRENSSYKDIFIEKFIMNKNFKGSIGSFSLPDVLNLYTLSKINRIKNKIIHYNTPTLDRDTTFLFTKLIILTMFIDILTIYSDLLVECTLNQQCKYCDNTNKCIIWKYSNNSIVDILYVIKKDLLIDNELNRAYYKGLQSRDNYLNKSNLISNKINEIENSFNKIKGYILDDIHYTERIDDNTIEKNVLSSLSDINTSINQLLNKRKYDVEIICNIVEENKRLKTLRYIIDYFNVIPSYTVYGAETANHELYQYFSNKLTIPSISLVINHISILKKYRNTNRPLLIMESDVVELYKLSDINNEIIKTMIEMEDIGVEITFLGKGCFNILDFNNLPHPLNKISETLYKTSHSRCNESVLFSPLGIRNFLEYIDSLISNNILIDSSIDWLMNEYFQRYPDRIFCWKIPELFLQGSFSKMYTSVHDI